MNIGGKWYTETEAAAYVMELEKLLRESLPVLRRAFFANYQDQDKCDELRERIRQKVGGADGENSL